MIGRINTYAVAAISVWQVACSSYAESIVVRPQTQLGSAPVSESDIEDIRTTVNRVVTPFGLRRSNWWPVYAPDASGKSDPYQPIALYQNTRTSTLSGGKGQVSLSVQIRSDRDGFLLLVKDWTGSSATPFTNAITTGLVAAVRDRFPGCGIGVEQWQGPSPFWGQ